YVDWIKRVNHASLTDTSDLNQKEPLRNDIEEKPTASCANIVRDDSSSVAKSADRIVDVMYDGLTS
ncbi:unnamed protein product, partial [Didymodactylos carnosus]